MGRDLHIVIRFYRFSSVAQTKRRDIAYSLVIIWALAGIIVKQAETQSIVITASISAIIIVVALILMKLKERV